MELVQRQTQQLTQQTLQSLALLQMSTVELEAYVQELAQENPIIDLEPPRSEAIRFLEAHRPYSFPAVASAQEYSFM